MSSRKRYWRWVRDIAIVGVIVVAIQWWQTRDMPRGEAPPLAGAGLQGEPISLATHRGQPVLIYFWAEWCPVCSVTSGNIASISEDYAVITVATTSGNAAEVSAYLNEKELVMPVVMDEAGDLARQWGVFGLPGIFVIDSEGSIDYATMGYSTEIGLRVRMALAD